MNTLNQQQTQIETLQQLHDALPKAGEFLGGVLWWVIPDNDDNQINHNDLKLLASKHSVPMFLLPNDINEKKAFNKAFAATKAEFNKDFSINFIVKPTGADLRFVVGIVKKKVDENENLVFSQKAKIKFFISTNQWELEISKNEKKIEIDSDEYKIEYEKYQKVLERLKDNYKKFQNHTCEDIRAIMKSFVRKYAIKLNPEGKSYFVARHHQHILNNLQSMIEDLSKENQINQLHLFGTPQSDKNLNRTAVTNFENEIEDLENDINNFIVESKGSSFMFTKGMKIREKRAKEIKMRIEVFASVLSFQHEKLIKKLSSLNFLMDDDIKKPVKNLSVSNDNFDSDNDSEDIDLSDDVGF